MTSSSPPRSASRRTRSHAATSPSPPARRTCAPPSASPRRAASARCRRGRWPAPAGQGAIDARLYDDAVWILRRYHLRVSAAREAGHHTHGDGTALDLIPADGNAQATWDRSAGAPRPRPRLDPGLRALRHPPRLPPLPRHPVHRLRRLPRPRLTAHLHRRLPRPPASLLGLAVLRHQPPLRALPMGDGVRRPAGRLPGRRAPATLDPADRRRPHPRHSRWTASSCSARGLTRALVSADACPVCLGLSLSEETWCSAVSIRCPVHSMIPLAQACHLQLSRWRSRVLVVRW